MIKTSFKAFTVIATLTALAAVSTFSATSAHAGGTGGTTPTSVDCSQLPAPHMTEQCNGYGQIQDISIEMTRTTTATDGTASDQIKSFYRSKSGRTVAIRFRQKTTKFVYELVALKPTSSDGYGEDVHVFTLRPHHTFYKIVAPKGFYVNFVYVTFPPAPIDDSASGLYSICGSMGCG